MARRDGEARELSLPDARDSCVHAGIDGDARVPEKDLEALIHGDASGDPWRVAGRGLLGQEAAAKAFGVVAAAAAVVWRARRAVVIIQLSHVATKMR